MSAAEFLTHMAEVSGLPPSTARTRAADTLRHAGLFEERYRAIGGYSTGMKQRVKLCQALVHDPAFVFLDEPTAGLDPVGREEMLTLIRKTHREFGISVLLSSHLMADVERTCDRIIVMQGGHLVHSGEVGQFTRETETVFIEVDTNREALVGALRAARRRGDRGGRRAHDRGAGRIGLRPRARRAGRGRGAAAPHGAAPPRAHRAVRAGDRMTGGTVFDIGYQSYTGAREGRGRALRAVFKDGVRIALGLGRGARAKILPWFFIGVLSAIALVMAMIAGAASKMVGEAHAEQLNLPSHSDFYGIASIILFVFGALVAPELLCRDRREGVIQLYLVRPLTGSDYIIARWAAFLAVMLAAAWLPQVILFLGLSMGATRSGGVPAGALARHPALPRWPALAMAAYVTTLALLTASFTTRRAYAAVFLVGLFVITDAIHRRPRRGDRGSRGPVDLDVQPHQHPAARERHDLRRAERADGGGARAPAAGRDSRRLVLRLDARAGRCCCGGATGGSRHERPDHERGRRESCDPAPDERGDDAR